ncbi:MAG: DUF4330 family protein [Oscillospiraceae bacterium]
MTKKFKFNIVDFIIIAIVVAAVALFCVKFIGDRHSDSYTVPTATVRVTFYCEETPSYVPGYTQVGDSVYNLTDKLDMGTIVDVTVGDSVTYVETDDGQVVKSTKEGYSSITIVTEMTGATLVEHGIQAGTTIVSPGHTITYYAGEGKYYGKVAGLEVIG